MKDSTSKIHKSAITDHTTQQNHVDSEGAKILDKDSNTFTRRIKEAIEIKEKGSGCCDQ